MTLRLFIADGGYATARHVITHYGFARCHSVKDLERWATEDLAPIMFHWPKAERAPLVDVYRARKQALQALEERGKAR